MNRQRGRGLPFCLGCGHVSAGYAGTENSARTLMALGRNMGKHIGLLDAQHLPTSLFEQFYQDCSLDA